MYSAVNRLTRNLSCKSTNDDAIFEDIIWLKFEENYNSRYKYIRYFTVFSVMFLFVPSHFDLIQPPCQVLNSRDVARYSRVKTPSLK